MVFDPADAGGGAHHRRGARPARAGRGEADGRRRLRRRSGVDQASFVVGERLFLADLTTGDVRELAPAGPAFDPRPDPYRTAGRLRRRRRTARDRSGHGRRRRVRRRSRSRRALGAGGVHRGRGDGPPPRATGGRPTASGCIAARVDERAVRTWHVSSPIDPAAAPRAVRYPQTGTANADVSACTLSGMDGSRASRWSGIGRRSSTWRRSHWSGEGAPLALVQSRDQRDVQVLAIDPVSGATEVPGQTATIAGPTLTPGVPAWLVGGRLLTGGASRRHALAAVGRRGGHAAGPRGGLRDRRRRDGHVHRDARAHGDARLAPGSARRTSSLGSRDAPGVHSAAAGGELTVLVSETPQEPLPTAVLRCDDEPIHTFARFAETPSILARADVRAPWGRSELQRRRSSRRAARSPPARCPSCWIRTGVRVMHASGRRPGDIWSRNGSPTRDSSCS